MNIELLTTNQDAKIGWFMVEGVEYGVDLSRTLYDADGNKISYPAIESQVIDVMLDKFRMFTGRFYYY